MNNTTQLGLNLTGGRAAGSGAPQTSERCTADDEYDEAAMMAVRMRYISEAKSIGSVPLPATLKGAVQAGVARLSGRNTEVLIDKLGERLAFERMAARLYDVLMLKCESALIDLPPGITIDQIRCFRDEEIAHFKLLVEALREMGADATAQTPSADTIGVQLSGLLQVISDPRTNVMQCLTAILTAEMTDNAGWELLIRLSREMGYEKLADSFHLAFQIEELHLHSIREWLESQVLYDAA
jgi:hypothetical protein